MRRIFKELPQLSIEESIVAAHERYPDFDSEERQLGVIVWENAVARIPLSRDLFTGLYDERWGVEGDDQRIVFRGWSDIGVAEVSFRPSVPRLKMASKYSFGIMPNRTAAP